MTIHDTARQYGTPLGTKTLVTIAECRAAGLTDAYLLQLDGKLETDNGYNEERRGKAILWDRAAAWIDEAGIIVVPAYNGILI